MTRFFFLSATVFSLAPALAARQSEQELLERVGKEVERFAAELSSVTCTEEILQQSGEMHGKRLVQKRSLFDYLILLQASDSHFEFEESRRPLGKEGKEPDRPLMITQGFASLLLVFHPYYRSGFSFERLEDDVESGRRFHRIQFTAVPGARSPAVIQLRGRNWELNWTGTAWIDADAQAVSRIESHLAAPMEPIGLQALASTVRYQAVVFTGTNEVLWLPAEAVIELKTARQYWRNTHRFSNWKRFVVDAQSSNETPER